MNGEDDTNRNADEGQRRPPLPAPAPPPANDAEVLRGTEGNPTGTPETETEKLLRGTRTIEILQFTANAALAVIGVVALCIYGGQLKVMRGQLSEIHSGSKDTHALAEAAKKQADKAETISESIKLAVRAMQDSADAAKSSANTSRKILEASTRPYVGISETIVDVNAPAHHLTYGFRIKNFSNSPAYKADFGWCSVMAGVSFTKVTDYPSHPHVIYPGQSFHLKSEIGGVYFDGIFSEKTVLHSTVFGTYEDDEGKKYEYCNKDRFDPNSGFADLGTCSVADERANAVKNGCR